MGPKLSKSRCNVECCVITFLEYYISAGKKTGEEQNREEREMAQKKLGGGRNRGKK